MRILFIGCVEISYRLLKDLLERHRDVVGVVTKKSSAFHADYVDLQPLCREYKIPCHYVKNINDDDSLEFIHSCEPDICYCFGWSQLLRETCMELFPQGVLGFHPAKLPYNRGRHPLIWALALGLDETASTFFQMNAEADAGAILSQMSIKIAYEDDARTLYDKVTITALEQEREFTEALEKGVAIFRSQNIAAGNVWRKRGKSDGQIDWRMPSRGIYNLVRSLTRPYVGAHFAHENHDYKVWKVAELPAMELGNIEPGKVLAVNGNGSIDVKAGSGVIRLLEFERPKINIGDYL